MGRFIQMASYYSSPGQHWRRVQEELLHKNEGLKEEHGRLQEEIDTLVDLLLQKDRDEPRIQVGTRKREYTIEDLFGPDSEEDSDDDDGEPRIQVGTRKREYTIEDLFGAESDTDDTFEGSKGITCVHHVTQQKTIANRCCRELFVRTK